MSMIMNTAGNEVIDWGLYKINAPFAWNYSKGDDIKIAILDSGCDHKHEDLAQNIVAIRDFTGSVHGAQDILGHGTHVAGIAAAIDNGIGMVGVAPHAKLLIAKVLNDDGTGNYTAIMNGLQWAIEEGADVINMSFGASEIPPDGLHQLIKKAHGRGIIMLSATGNENSEVCWPAQYEEVIAVSAVDEKDERASFSNYGITNEIIAPGVNIMSTFPGNQYATLSGTSMASPVIAGAAALWISYIRKKQNRHPSLEEVHATLIKATEDLGPIGADLHYGKGRIDLLKLFEV